MEPGMELPQNSIDIESLRLSQDFAENTEVEKVLSKVSVCRPNPQTFVRVHPALEYHFPTCILKLKDENEHLLVAKELWAGLSDEIIPVMLFLSITREGVVFLWANRLPGEDGRIDEWNRTARIAIEAAMRHWIRVKANRHLGGYEFVCAPGSYPEPIWPRKTMDEIIQIAFRDRFIADHDHPVLKRLRGEL